MVVQLVIQLCRTLQGATKDCFWSHIVAHSLAYQIKSSLKLVMTYTCSGSIYMKEMKIKQNSVDFQN